MLGTSAVPATLPTLMAEWGLSPAEAGWLSGSYFLGYAVAVPVLVSLTDRVDPRTIFALSCTIGVIANAGIASFAHGLASATAFWILAGVSLAGIYMPGLRIITERVAPAFRLRAVPYYTASFGIGIAASFFVAGWFSHGLGWRAAFLVGAVGCLASIACLALGTMRTATAVGKRTGSGAFDLRGVLKNTAAMRYIVAYGGHCWELFALRAWLVAFLLFAWKRTTTDDPGQALTSWSSIVALAGVPASILGAEAALRFGRRSLIGTISIISIAIALATAWLGAHAFLPAVAALALYSVLILGKSGAITAGLVDAANPETQGSTLALHSLAGFSAAALSPIAVGITLGLTGGNASSVAWLAAFSVMTAGSALAALAILAR